MDEMSVQEFCEHWKLNSDAQNKLFGLSPNALQTVLREFQPPRGSAEVNGKFIVFAASVENRMRNSGWTNTPSAPAQVRWMDKHSSAQEFCQRWNLSVDGQNKLAALSPGAQEAVMRDFDPPAGASDVNGKFIMFAASVEKRTKGQGKGKTSGRNPRIQAAAAPQGMDPEAFCQQWGLNEDAYMKIMKLSPEAQFRAMSEFAPPAGSIAGGFSGKFIMFAASIEKRLMHHQPPPTRLQPFDRGAGHDTWGTLQAGNHKSVEEFCTWWNLNNDSLTKLMKQPPAVVTTVMQEFDPKGAHGADLNGKFLVFATSVEKRMKQQGSPAPVIRPARQGAFDAPPRLQPFHRAAPEASSLQDQMSAFCEMWGLDADSWNALAALNGEQAQMVLQEFSLETASSSEINQGFLAFCAEVADRFQVTEPCGDSQASLEEFSQHWALNEDARNKLWKLMPETQATVLREFLPAPREGTNDVNGIFIMFAASVEKRLKGGKGGGNCGGKGKMHAQPPQPMAYIEPQAVSFADDFSADLHASLGEFIQHWALNEDAQTKLWKLTPEAQATVMQEFMPAPREGTNDVNGKFIMFAASVAGRLKGGKGGGKVGNKGGGQGGGKGNMYAQPTQPTGYIEPPAVAGFAGLGDLQAALVEFIQHWNLNEDAQTKLWNITAEAQATVLQEFMPAPREGTDDVNGKFIMFAASVAGRLKGGKGGGNGGGKGKMYAQPTRPMGYIEPPAVGSVDEFGRMWGLNADALTKLMRLPAGVQQTVMSEFKPPPNAHGDVNGKFIMFAASVEKRVKGGGAAVAQHPRSSAQALQYDGGFDGASLQSFCSYWNLNADAQGKLASLSPATQEVVLREFSPPPGSTEVSGMFIVFASSIAKRIQMEGGKGHGKRSSAFMQDLGRPPKRFKGS